MIKTAVSDTSLWTPRQVLLAPLWGVATTTRLQGKAGLPSQWQLYQRRATLGSKHLCQTFKGGEQAGRIKTAAADRCRALCLSSITKSNGRIIWYIWANEQSLTSISAVFVTSTISFRVFNRAFHQFYFNPPTWQGGFGPGRQGKQGKLGNCACVASLIKALTPATIYKGPFWQEKSWALVIVESVLSMYLPNQKYLRIIAKNVGIFTFGTDATFYGCLLVSPELVCWHQRTKDVSQHFHFLLLSSWHPSDWWPGDAPADHIWSPDRRLSAPLPKHHISHPHSLTDTFRAMPERKQLFNIYVFPQH